MGWALGDRIVALNFHVVSSAPEWRRVCRAGYEDVATRGNALFVRRDVTSNATDHVYMMVTVRRPRSRASKPTRAHVSQGYAGSLEIYVDDDGQEVRFDSMGRKYPVDSYGVRSIRLPPGAVPVDFSEDDYRVAIREARRQKMSMAEYLHRIREMRKQNDTSSISSGVYKWRTLPRAPPPLPLDEPDMDDASQNVPIGPAERDSGASSSSASPAAAARRSGTSER